MLENKNLNKKGRGRPKLTEEQKMILKAKRDAGKTKKFSVGEEPNKRNLGF